MPEGGSAATRQHAQARGLSGGLGGPPPGSPLPLTLINLPLNGRGGEGRPGDPRDRETRETKMGRGSRWGNTHSRHIRRPLGRRHDSDIYGRWAQGTEDGNRQFTGSTRSLISCEFIEQTFISKLHVDLVNKCCKVKLAGQCKGKTDCPFNFVSFVPNLDYKMHQVKHRLNTGKKKGKKKTLLLRYVSWGQ